MTFLHCDNCGEHVPCPVCASNEPIRSPLTPKDDAANSAYKGVDVELPLPYDYCYEWDGPYGKRKFSASPHNGSKCDRSIPLFTAEQMKSYALQVAGLASSHPIQEQAEMENELDFEPDAHHAVSDMANIGYGLMKCIKSLRPDYSWSNSPVEIVRDLIDELDAIKEGLTEVPAELEPIEDFTRRMEEAQYGATCPMCGKTGMHRHSPEEIIIYRNGLKHGARQQKHSGADDQGHTENEKNDASGLGAGGRIGENERDAHRAGQSGSQHECSGTDSGSNGISGAVPIQAETVIGDHPIQDKPIDLILYCPKCGLQHVDEPDERTPDWSNPAHRSHLCHGCNHIWRPADVPTNGVKAIKTKGKADSEISGHPIQEQAEPEEDEWLIKRMSTILAGVAVALKGTEEPRSRHGYQDLVEVAEKLALELAVTKQLLAEEREIVGLHSSRHKNTGPGEDKHSDDVGVSHPIQPALPKSQFPSAIEWQAAMNEIQPAPAADLLPHLRQFQHNDGSGFVAGYDKPGIDRLVAYLRSQASTKFEDVSDLIAWLDTLHSTDGGNTVTAQKWPPAQKAIAALLDGNVVVPSEPTESMIIAGFESAPDRVFDGDDYPEEYDHMSGCQQAAFRAKRCYAAMLAAAPDEPIRTPLTNNIEEGNSASEGFEVGFRAPEQPAQPAISEIDEAKKTALEVFKESCSHTHDAIEYFSELLKAKRLGQLNTPAAPSNQVPDLHSTMDAKVWTDEFCRINPNADWGTMIGWFSNAIMAGFDEANRRAPSNTQVPEGWKWMTHPHWNNGKPIPVKIYSVDGTVFYCPFDSDDTDFEWDLRDEKWKEVDSIQPASEIRAQALEEAAKACDEVRQAGRVHAAQDCATAIRALIGQITPKAEQS